MQDYITSMSWSYSNGYHHNYHTGEGFFSSSENIANATKKYGGYYDRYTIFETGVSLDGGKTFVGNGNFGVIHEGIMKSTGLSLHSLPNHKQQNMQTALKIVDTYSIVR